MNDGFDPQWELLPHQPEQFFQLSGNYDLRDLKRSYNQLIRRFKPERFPVEFQRIRSAYELLIDALRYNLPARPATPSNWPLSLQKPATPPHETQTVPPSPETIPLSQSPQRSIPLSDSSTPPSPPSAAEGPPAPLRERILRTPLSALYAELSSRPHKTGEDYVTLAIMSDVVVDGDPASRLHVQSFVDWLLAGLKNDPNDWGLTQLLREYVAQEHSPAELTSLLLRAVEVVPTSRFQYVTERAWDRLLRVVPFVEFRQCLQRCGTRLGSPVDHTQLIFYVHILKLAMWKADEEFLAEMQGVVDDHFHSLGHWAQGEYEMVSMLLDYKSRREQFVRLGPCCRRIDQAIQDWCLLSESEGDLRVLECQYFLSLRGRRLLEEFRDFKADFAYVLLPWDRIVSDVLERLDEPAKLDESALEAQARDFMIRATRRHDRTSKMNEGCVLVLVCTFVWLIAFMVAGPFSFYSCATELIHGHFFMAFLWGVLTLITAAIYLTGMNLGLGWAHKQFYVVRYELVRPELIKLMRIVQVPIEELADAIEARENEEFGENNRIGNADVIAEKMKEDAGLELFNLAQRCLNAAASEKSD